jgi:hypothetical protein
MESEIIHTCEWKTPGSKAQHTRVNYLAAMRILIVILCLGFLIEARNVLAADIYCSDLTAVSSTSGWSTVQKDMSIGSKPITLAGKVYAKGLGTHSPSEIVYNLNAKYTIFTTEVGVDDGTAGKGSVEFQVFVDDSLAFTSGVMKGNMVPKLAVIEVNGKKKLKLVVTIGPDTYDWDDADWAGARLTEKPVVALFAKGPKPFHKASAPQGWKLNSKSQFRDIFGRLQQGQFLSL